jgi:hypothetical protein
MTLLRRILRARERPGAYCLVGVYGDVEAAEEAARLLDAGRFPIGQITLVTQNPVGAGMLLTGSLALRLVGEVEGVVTRGGAAGWLRQLMAWGLSPQAIRLTERHLRAGRALLIAHGRRLEVARAFCQLTGNGALELQLHVSSSSEIEAAILRG